MISTDASFFTRPTSNFSTTNTSTSLQKPFEHTHPPDSYTSTSKTPAMNSPEFGGGKSTRKEIFRTEYRENGDKIIHFRVLEKRTGKVIAPYNKIKSDKYGKHVKTYYCDKYGNVEETYP